MSYEQSYAMSLLQDVPIRTHISSRLPLPASIWRVMDDIDRTSAEFLPYWDNAATVNVSPTGAQFQLNFGPMGWKLVRILPPPCTYLLLKQVSTLRLVMRRTLPNRGDEGRPVNCGPRP